MRYERQNIVHLRAPCEFRSNYIFYGTHIFLFSVHWLVKSVTGELWWRRRILYTVFFFIKSVAMPLLYFFHKISSHAVKGQYLVVMLAFLIHIWKKKIRNILPVINKVSQTSIGLTIFWIKNCLLTVYHHKSALEQGMTSKTQLKVNQRFRPVSIVLNNRLSSLLAMISR